VYSARPDTRLDVYPLDKGQKLAPVIVFIYGGGWRSGDKKMYAPLAETFQKKGHVVVIPNYTLYPKGKIPDMMLDIQNVLLWTFHHIQ
jgi:acetyl esterase/lipase